MLAFLFSLFIFFVSIVCTLSPRLLVWHIVLIGLGALFLVVGVAILVIIIIVCTCELCQSNNCFAKQYFLQMIYVFLLSNVLVEILHDATTYQLFPPIFVENNIVHCKIYKGISNEVILLYVSLSPSH